MQLKIEPTSELSIKLGDKRIGKLDGLYIDLVNSTRILMFSIPKIKLGVSIYASTFDGDTKKLDNLLAKVSKATFLDVTLIK